MIRLVVSDIDGTLVTNDKTLTGEVRQAAHRLAQAGVQLVLVSSRPPHGVALFADDLKLTTPRAAFNGGVFTSSKGDLISAAFLQETAAHEAIDYLASQNIPPWLFTVDEWLITDPTGDYVDWEQHTVKLPPHKVPSLAPFTKQVGKLMAATKDFAKLAICEVELQRRLQGRAAVHRSQDYYLDITHPNANKGEAVCKAASLLGIDLEDTACIGDMPNDLPMFDVAAYRIAMGNAPSSMQARADYVAPSNQASGWANAIEQFIIPRA